MSKIKISALGGIGEHGKYLFVVEINDAIFILDAGLKNPEVDFFGIDAVIPDMSYLVQNKDRIEAIILSHGHEENIGALPYLLRMIKTKVFATHFTISILENLLVKNGMNISDYKLFRINDSKVLTFKDVTINFFATTHSIPESLGVSITVPEDGTIVYAPDFNFSAVTAEKYRTNFGKLAEIASNKVLLVLAESLGITEVDRVTNNTMYEHTIQSVLTNNKGRVFAAAFSTDLNRIQTIVDIGVKNQRKIALLYKKTDRILDVAISNGLLKIPQESFVTLSTENANDQDLLVIIAGTRTDRYTILQGMVSGKDKLLQLHEEDNVIIVSRPLIGTELYAVRVLDSLYEKDVKITTIDNNMLRSSHASIEDLNVLYRILRPQYFLPIIGEYRHQIRHIEVLKHFGYAEEQIVVLDNGFGALFEDGIYTEKFEVPHGDILVDGTLMGSVDQEIMMDRTRLGESGAMFVFVTIDSKAKVIHQPPYVFTRGYVELPTTNDTKAKIIDIVTKMIQNAMSRNDTSVESMKKAIEAESYKIVSKFEKTKPMIVPLVIECPVDKTSKGEGLSANHETINEKVENKEKDLELQNQKTKKNTK